MILLEIIYILIGIFVVTFLEGFLSSLIGLRITFIILLLLYKKIDWRILFLIMFFLFLISDITSHYILGTNLLIALVSLVFFAILCIFVTTETGVFSWLVKFLTFFLYYILLATVPTLFISQKFSNITVNTLTHSLLISLISVLLTTLLQRMIGKIRDESGERSKIKLSR
ncbi:MAG: hypothetical protein ACOX6Q_00610 [Candidatus Dojkabacteria bacterium]|jgi:hypothetical protein